MPPALLVILLLGGLLALALLLRRLLGRLWLYRTIFEAETPAGRVFDVVLLVAILLSVLEVILESDPQLRLDLAGLFQAAEWAFTLLFTLEYLLRLLCVPKPLRYARSFLGVGYGDVAPVTPLGRFMASVVMLLGYSIIAVPTGIVTAEFGQASARHCKHCGAGL